MRVEFHLSLSELTALERCETSAELARRMRIVILAMNGWTAPAVAMATGLSRRVCQEWVARFNESGPFNESGLSGLEDRRGRVSRSPLTSEQEVAAPSALNPGRRKSTRCVRCEAKISNASWQKSSACSDHWRRFTTCCIRWGIRICVLDRFIASPIP